MKRYVSLDEISDGKLYGPGDMVRAGCGDCSDCSECCRGMGSSIVLDPLDVYRLTVGLGTGFGDLMTDRIELNVVDGVILPNLKMTGKDEACAFLDGGGRCSIHSLRPGICRLFPLGRYYEEGGFRYFLQIHECRKQNRTKVKVCKWIDTPDPARYEQFVIEWHFFLKAVEELLRSAAEGDFGRNLNIYLLKLFFMRPYEQEKSFYAQFAERMAEARELLDCGKGRPGEAGNVTRF